MIQPQWQRNAYPKGTGNLKEHFRIIFLRAARSRRERRLRRTQLLASAAFEMPLRPCALTHRRSSRGADKEAGMCRLTRVVAGVEARGDKKILLTTCGRCRSTSCVDCWECIADIACTYAERIDLAPAWVALLVRAWRAGTPSTKGFQAAADGGGTWLLGCPLCIEQRFEPAPVPLPRLSMGLEYSSLAPRLRLQQQLIIHSRVPGADGSWSRRRGHSCEVLVYEQLVPDDEARHHTYHQ